mmetsp:Transcript_26471/g.72699  ORF Transcript_26471/g.72699 Transcript_26471/m.72699 type:complete len:82 (-) Transcript_26471:316-561(-)
MALEFAADGLRADFEIVLAAVQQEGLALQFAAEPLHWDKRIVHAALHRNCDAIKHLKVDVGLKDLGFDPTELKAMRLDRFC